MVELDQKQNASRMLEMLSRLFRLSLKKTSGPLIPLQEELVHANTYMGIQQMRFRHKLVYTTEIEDGLSDIYVMRFILQSLLENSITHGISTSEGAGEVSLNIYRQEDPEPALIYYIYDSGLEADEQKINKILNMKPDERQDTVGLALQNINGRLKIKFGDPYGITFRKIPGVGTVFIVSQPFITKEDLENHA